MIHKKNNQKQFITRRRSTRGTLSQKNVKRQILIYCELSIKTNPHSSLHVLLFPPLKRNEWINEFPHIIRCFCLVMVDFLWACSVNSLSPLTTNGQQQCRGWGEEEDMTPRRRFIHWGAGKWERRSLPELQSNRPGSKFALSFSWARSSSAVRMGTVNFFLLLFIQCFDWFN